MSNSSLDLFKQNLQFNAMLTGMGLNKKLKKPPKWLNPTNVEKLYRKELHKIVKITNDNVKLYLLPELQNLVNQYNMDKVTYDSNTIYDGINDAANNDSWGDDTVGTIPAFITDSYVDNINEIFNKISFNVANEMPNPKVLAETVGGLTAAFNNEQFHKMINQVFGTDAFVGEPWLSSQLDLFTTGNTELIRDLPVKELGGMKQIVMSGVGSGRQASDISRAIQKQFGVAERRANTIARDQVSKLNGQLTGVRQQSIGITQYTWQTSEDERVRRTHRDNDQKVFNWNDPPAETGNPGSDINCRCVGIPVIPDV